MKDYIKQALVTCSTSFHGEKVGADDLMDSLESVYENANYLDILKKGMFYGKGEGNALAAAGQIKNAEYLLQFLDSDRAKAVQILHGLVGLTTEVGEQCEAVLRAHNNGEMIDKVNLSEELGDALWYIAIMMDAIGTDFETVMAQNIAKLRARFGDKFSEFDANNRNLDNERQVLEGKPLLPEEHG